MGIEMVYFKLFSDLLCFLFTSHEKSCNMLNKSELMMFECVYSCMIDRDGVCF